MSVSPQKLRRVFAGDISMPEAMCLQAEEDARAASGADPGTGDQPVAPTSVPSVRSPGFSLSPSPVRSPGFSLSPGPVAPPVAPTSVPPVDPISPFDSAQGLQPAALGCDQAKAAVDALRPDIAAHGPEALQTLLAQTDALLERSPHWSKCQRAARYRSLLAAYAASRNRAIAAGDGGQTAATAAVPPASPVPQGDPPVAPTDNPAAASVRATGGSPSDALPPSNLQSEIPHSQSSEASGPPKPQADAGLLPYNTSPAPDSIPFFDLVVPLGTASKHDDLELRYLLRSALANLSQPINRQDAKDAKGNQEEGGAAADSPQPGSSLGELGGLAVQPSSGPCLRRIHLIGPKRPAWFHDDPMIHWHQWTPIKPKNHDIVAKFIHAAKHPDVAEYFLASCDDFLFLRPFRPGLDYGAVRRHGVLSNQTTSGYWKRVQAETRSLLEADGYKAEFFDYHVPTLMTKTGWRKVDAEIPWKSVPGHAVWSLYHNVAGVHGPALGRDGRSHFGWHAGDGSKAPASLDDVERAAFNRLFLNYNDGGLKGGILESWLAKRFPDPAPWEPSGPEPGRRGRETAMTSRSPRESAMAAPAASSVPVRSPGFSLSPPPSPAAPPADPRTGDSRVAPTPLRQAQGLRPAACGFPHDLDILVVLYGRSLPRAAAVARTFARWHKHQQPMPRVLCAWCYRDGEAPGDLRAIPDYPWLKRIRLPQYDLDDGVFRKEGLLNYLLRDHATAPYILTLDADVWTPTKGWFRSIRDKLAEHPDHVLQPFRYFKDTKENVGAWSWSAQTLPDLNPAKCKHPGLGWAFTRQWADKHGDQTVFNPWHVAGSGDCSFVLEHFKGKQRKSYASKYAAFPYFERVFRNWLPEGRLAGVETKVWHQNHTNKAMVPPQFQGRALADRAYEWSRHALDPWGDLGQYLYLDTNGVPLLRDSASPFARVLRRKPEMQDRQSTERILAESLGLGADTRFGLPGGDKVSLYTWPGIGDHIMMLGVVNRLHRERPDTAISVHLTKSGLEPWFLGICPSVQFSQTPGDKLVWRHGPIPSGQHAVARYGAEPDDIVLPPPDMSTPSIHSIMAIPGPRIAFVTETGGAHLARKQWPHWRQLAGLVRARYDVAPFWIGTETKADPIHTLPALLNSMDVVVAIEGMASHICWAIRKPAVVLVTGAIDPTALCYPGFHTILRGQCPNRRYCDCYTRPSGHEPQCKQECMSTIGARIVLEEISAHFPGGMGGTN